MLPRWFKEYNFREAYNVSDLSPAGLNELLNEFAMKSDKLQLYWKHKIKSNDPHLKQDCDRNCRVNELCLPVYTEHSARSVRCEQLTKILENNYN